MARFEMDRSLQKLGQFFQVASVSICFDKNKNGVKGVRRKPPPFSESKMVA